MCFFSLKTFDMSYMTRSKRILLSLEKNDTKRLESLESYNVAPSYESLRGSTSKEQNKLLKSKYTYIKYTSLTL